MWVEVALAGGAGAGAAWLFASTFTAVRGVHDLLVPGARFRTGGPEAALTFDDGPDPEVTPRILDLLAEAGVRASFFVVGERAERHPDLVRRIAQEGHAVGNHSWSHAWLPFCGARRMRAELLRCQELLGDLLGQAPTMIRPPYGARDVRVYRLIQALGLTPVLWSLDSRDWAGAPPARIEARLDRAQGGDVVLLHDGDPKATSTCAALEAWLSKPGRVPLGPLSQPAGARA
jgi:peptidoglycan/xylan/chitin deacetylase (PgdA/CDA1 family)